MKSVGLSRQAFRSPSPAARDAALIGGVTALTLCIELALVERKYGIIGGGFGQSQALAGIGPIVGFGLVILCCQAWLMTIVFAAMRAIHRRLGAQDLFCINFTLLVPGLYVALLAAEYEILSYFSDAISLQLVRNLAGGSLIDALLFVMSDGALAAGGLVAGLAGYFLALRYFRRVRRGGRRAGTTAARSADEDRVGLRIRPLWFALATLLLAAAIYIGNARGEVRASLSRFNSYLLINAALDKLTDFDGDGYGLYSKPQDPYPFDASRYPYALDIPGNGLDEDGLGGDFKTGGPSINNALLPVSAKLPAHPKNLVIVVLESTRFDAVGRRFRGHPVTPNIDAIAGAGSAFPAAYSHVGFTTESLKSLFSGQLEPRAGGPSLFRDLKANGYRIGVFSGQPESFGDISEVVGMRASADVFRDGETLAADRAFGFAAKGSLLVDGKILLREFDRTFGRPDAWTRPVFLYFNLQSAHFPYYHPGMEQILPGRPIPREKIGIDTRDWVAATYWNAVAQADGQIGMLVARLKALGVYDNSIILVTADHGESLFDDGFLGHGHMLNRQQTHIPLVINVPGIADSSPRGLQDFRPLLLRLLGARQARETARRDRPVLEYIGTLDRPTFVGAVDASRRWTVLKVQDRSVRFSDVPGVYDYDALASRPALKQRADTLVRSWEMARWEKHLGQRRR